MLATLALALGVAPAVANEPATDAPAAEAGAASDEAASRPDPAPAPGDTPTDRPAQAPADGQDPPPSAEIVVVGEEAVDEARRALNAALERQGWELRRQRADGTLVFKTDQAWKGAVLVGEHGSIRTRRPVVYGRIGFPFVNFNLLPSKKKLRGVRKAVVGGVQPELTALHEALQGAALHDRLSELPARLDALWADGTPLVGGEPLPDLASRRAAVLDFWATRTETEDGRAVQAVVSDWLRAVVMTSEAPLTAEEVASAEARRTDGARVLGELGQ